MKLIILESPYKGEVGRNVAYARCAVKHCLSLGESPIASHLLFPQDGILDDLLPDQRELGIRAGELWRARADYTVHYLDFGASVGMIRAKRQIGLHVHRYLPDEFWSPTLLTLCGGRKPQNHALVCE